MFVDGVQFQAVLIVHNIYKLIYCNICVFFPVIGKRMIDRIMPSQRNTSPSQRFCVLVIQFHI